MMVRSKFKDRDSSDPNSLWISTIVKYFLTAMATLWILSIAFVIYVGIMAALSSWLNKTDDERQGRKNDSPCG